MCGEKGPKSSKARLPETIIRFKIKRGKLTTGGAGKERSLCYQTGHGKLSQFLLQEIFARSVPSRWYKAMSAFRGRVWF